MKRFLTTGVATLALAATGFAQKAPQAKTKEELAALQAAFAAQNNPDAQIAAAKNVLEKFADTQFKPVMLQFLTQDYKTKGDFANTVFYGDLALKADPNDYQSMLVLGQVYVQNTRDTDFDKEDKLKKADDYANQALTLVSTIAKPRPQIPDDQWAVAKKDWTASGHEVLGSSAMLRKKPDLAVKEFQTALESASMPDPSTYVRLAKALNMSGKYDEAIAAADKASASANAIPQVKQAAQAERARASGLKAKAAATPMATPAADATAAKP